MLVYIYLGHHSHFKRTFIYYMKLVCVSLCLITLLRHSKLQYFHYYMKSKLLSKSDYTICLLCCLLCCKFLAVYTMQTQIFPIWERMYVTEWFNLGQLMKAHTLSCPFLLFNHTPRVPLVFLFRLITLKEFRNHWDTCKIIIFLVSTTESCTPTLGLQSCTLSEPGAPTHPWMSVHAKHCLEYGN